MPSAGIGPAATMRFELGAPDSGTSAESQEGGEYFTAAVALSPKRVTMPNADRAPRATGARDPSICDHPGPFGARTEGGSQPRGDGCWSDRQLLRHARNRLLCAHRGLAQVPQASARWPDPPNDAGRPDAALD